MEQFSKSEHAFDIDAEPEPVPMECGAGDAGDDDTIVDDGFGPVGDVDDCDDIGDRGKPTDVTLTSNSQIWYV